MYAGEMLARITADTSGLKAGVASANTTLKSFAQVATTSSAQATQALDKISKSSELMSKGLNQAKNTALGFAAGTGMMMFFQGAVSAAKSSVIDFNSQLEQATIGFTTMLGGATQAEAKIKELQAFAAKTPFEFPELIQATQRLLAYGYAAKEITPALKNIGDFVAGMGGSMAGVGSQIIRALGQIRAKGKLAGQEMMQLSEAGVGAWKYIADSMGLSVKEVMAKSQAGAIDAASAIKAILAGMGKDFGGMMEGQSKTLMGAFSTVKDYVRINAAEMTKPLYEKTRDAVLKMSVYLSSPAVQKAAEDMAGKLSVIMTKAFSAIGEAVKQIAPVLKQVFATISAHASDFSAIGEAFASIAKAAMAFGVELLKIGGAWAGVITPVASAAIKALATLLTSAANAMQRHATIVKTLAIAYATLKLGGLVADITRMIVKAKASAVAHLEAAAAATAESVANAKLLASQRALYASGKGGGVVGGMVSAAQLGKINSGIAAMGTNMSKLGKVSAAAKNSVSGIVSGLGGPMMIAGMAIVTVGMAAMASNAEMVKKSLSEWSSGLVKGVKDARSQYAILTSEVDKIKSGDSNAKSNRDRQYEGGFWNDLGAATINILDVPNWFDYGNQNSDAIDEASGKAADALKRDNELQQSRMDEIIAAAVTFGDNQQAEWAKATDELSKEQLKMAQAEENGYAAILSPLSDYAKNQQTTFQEMLANMSSNNKNLKGWQDDLTFLLKNGQTEAAAYFASLGPSGAQAMNDLIHGSKSDMEKFNAMMHTQWALAGSDAESEVLGGLAKIPSLVKAAGLTDIYEALMGQADAIFTKPVLKMTNEYAQALQTIKNKATETISTLPEFSADKLVDPKVQKRLDDLILSFRNLDPAVLVGAGITPEALQIPQVEVALAEMKQKGVTDPLTIATNIGVVLSQIEGLKGSISSFIAAPIEIEVKLQTNVDDILKQMRYKGFAGGIVRIVDRLVEKIQTAQTSKAPPVAPTYQTPPVFVPKDLPPLTPPPPVDVKKADGGFTGAKLPKSATIQKPGTLVQWAEPSTGGEAFIPLSPAKRERSLEIWHETGKRLGVPTFSDGGMKPPAAFADGGFTHKPPAPALTKFADGGFTPKPPTPMKFADGGFTYSPPTPMKFADGGFTPEPPAPAPAPMKFADGGFTYSPPSPMKFADGGFTHKTPTPVQFSDGGFTYSPPARMKFADGGFTPEPPAPIQFADGGFTPEPPAPMKFVDGGFTPEPPAPIQFADGGFTYNPPTPMKFVDGGFTPEPPAPIQFADGGYTPPVPTAFAGGGITPPTPISFGDGGYTPPPPLRPLRTVKQAAPAPATGPAFDAPTAPRTNGSGKSGGKGAEPVDWWEILKKVYEAKDISDVEMRKVVQARIQSEQKYSDTWFEAVGMEKAMVDKMNGISDVQFQLGETSTSDYLADLTKRMNAEEKYSNEWMSLHNQIEGVTQKEIADKKALADSANNKVEAQFSLGEISSSDYIKALTERMNAEEKYSSEWMSLHGKIASVLDEETRKQQESADAWRSFGAGLNRVVANMFAVGDLGKDKYLDILRKRLDGLTKYSDEWMSVWNEIESVTNSAGNGIADSVASAFKSMYDSVAGPIKQATSVVSAFGQSTNVTFEQILGFYDNVSQGAQQWEDALNSLKQLGLDPAIYNDLAKQGPHALGLANALISGGAAGIADINSKSQAVGGIAVEAGLGFAGSSATQVGTQLNIGDITIDLSGSSLTSDQVKTMLTDAFTTLAHDISVGAI